jgi:hypothetical protein
VGAWIETPHARSEISAGGSGAPALARGWLAKARADYIGEEHTRTPDPGYAAVPNFVPPRLGRWYYLVVVDVRRAWVEAMAMGSHSRRSETATSDLLQLRTRRSQVRVLQGAPFRFHRSGCSPAVSSSRRDTLRSPRAWTSPAGRANCLQQLHLPAIRQPTEGGQKDLLAMPTLGSLFEQFLRERTYLKNVSPKTRVWYETAWKTFPRHAGAGLRDNACRWLGFRAQPSRAL